MRGLLQKIYIEVRIPVLLFSIGLALIMGLLTSLLPQVLGDIDRVFAQMPFIKPILTALLGVDPGKGFTAQMTQAFLWVHPTVLALIWGHELMYCSRVPAAEIDRGTVDFLLGLPLSRWKLYVVETIGWLVSGLVILSVGWVGHAIASTTIRPDMLPGAFETFSVVCNLFAVYMAVGAITFVVSASSNHRGRVIGIVFAILLFSFLLNFLAQFWDPAKHAAFLSIMDYYRPAKVIESGAFPMRDVSILSAIAVLAWVTGGSIFARRSISTV